MFPGFSLEFKKYGLGITEVEWFGVFEFVCVDWLLTGSGDVCVDWLFASMDAIEGPWCSDTI